MFSFKGPGLKIFASVLAAIALIAGIWFTFFQSAGFEKTTATIVSIQDDPDDIPEEGSTPNRIIMVKYTVNGKEYTARLDTDAPNYAVGTTVEVQYDPKNPGTIHSGFGFGIYLIIAGGAILAIVIVSTIVQKVSVKKLKETQGETVYAPSEQGEEERELYFITDVGTPKYGHRLEDKNRKVLYEAKMTKFAVATPYRFDFIDHTKNKTTEHLVGQQEETDWNSLILDNHYTFKLDGEDIWKHLKRNGITITSRFASGKVLVGAYNICRNDIEIAHMESTSQYVHEEDEEKHKVASKIPVRGFYRVYTKEKNLDLLFVTILAVARSGANDSKGGGRSILFNTIKGE